MKTTTVLLLTVILFACSASFDVDDYFSLEQNEIIRVKEFGVSSNFLEYRMTIVEAGSENLEIIRQAFTGARHWKRNRISHLQPKIEISGDHCELLIFENYVLLRDEEKQEFLCNLSIWKELDNLTYGTNDYELEGLFGRGTLVKDSWTFCSTVAVENEYEYKKGYWKVWNEEFKLIGEGDFQVKKGVIEHTNCGPEDIRYGVIDTINWKNYYQGELALDSLFHKIENSETKKLGKLPF